MRRAAAVIVVGLVGLTGCNDVRDFAGTWTGESIRELPSPSIGYAGLTRLTIDAIDKHGVRGSLVVHHLAADGPTLIDTTFSSLETAEADALATMTFAGDPLRVYLAFVPREYEPAGTALAIISLYDSHRIELRLLAGEPDPLYAIIPLSKSE